MLRVCAMNFGGSSGPPPWRHPWCDGELLLPELAVACVDHAKGLALWQSEATWPLCGWQHKSGDGRAALAARVGSRRGAAPFGGDVGGLILRDLPIFCALGYYKVIEGVVSENGK